MNTFQKKKKKKAEKNKKNKELIKKPSAKIQETFLC